jgi:predicted signal transduction protein with EAL and GGDEF domain
MMELAYSAPLTELANSRALQAALIGIGLFPNDVPDAMSLFALADTAVLMAKREGKNRTYIFESVRHALDP